MKFVFSNNVSTLLHEELSANASEMRTQKLPEGIHWPFINNSEGEVAPCTIIDPATRAWEIIYVKEVIEGPTYDTLKITRGEEETGPNSFSKNSRVELRVTAGSLYANSQNVLSSIPTATKTNKGLVQVGKNLNVTQDGEISIPTASKTEAGAVKVGDNLQVDADGTVSTPIATDTVAGVIKVGENLKIDTEGNLSVSTASSTEAGVVKLGEGFATDVSGNIILPIATTTEAGIIKVGDRLNVASDGTLSAPSASSTVEGMVKIGEGLEFDASGALVTSVKELPTATTAKAGIVQLSSATDSTSETLAATAKAVKAAWDKATSAAMAVSTPATTSSLGVVRIGQGIDVDANGIISTTPVSTATTAEPGIVQLSSAVDSTSETLAATPKAVKAAYDRAGEAASTASAASSVVAAALWGYVTREKQFIRPSSSGHYGFLFRGGTYITLTIDDGNGIPQDIVFGSKTDVTFNDARQLLDTGSSFSAGRDYYIYAVLSESANSEIINPIKLVVSLNSTYPSGYNTDNSRKIGGFHTLCVDVGTISGHPLSGLKAGQILPDSFWCLTCRPATCGPEGMVFLEKLGVWVDIYLQSGTGANTASVYNGTVTRNQSWDSHAEDLAKVGKRMLQDTEYTMAIWGTQPYKGIMGNEAPTLTGGHINTDNRRIISNIGCEDTCGACLIWLNNVGGGGGSGWSNLIPNDQGSIYGISLALQAGGWPDGGHSGPRCRVGSAYRREISASNSTHGAARTI